MHPTATSIESGNPERAKPGWPAVVIAGGYQTGVLAMRGLLRRGVRASCVDANPRNPAFRSAYGKALACTNPDTDSSKWLSEMLALAATFEQPPVLIPSSDQFVTAMARHEDSLRNHFVTSPGLRLQGLLADKQSQYALAQQHRMPMPVTSEACDDADVVAFAAAARLPCLVKPMHFREWQRLPADHPQFDRKVAVATSVGELLSVYRAVAATTPRVMLQEIIVGADTDKRVYLGVYDRDSRRIGTAMFKELRCEPIGFGPASVTEPIDDAEADEVCDSFLRAIGYAGICEIEVKRDVRDGRVKLIEANPRLSGSGDGAPYAGVDMCWLHYLDLIGQTVEPVRPASRSFRHVVLRADGGAVPSSFLAGQLTMRDLLHSYTPPLAFYDLDVGDWRYSLRTLKAAAGAFVRAVLRKVRR